jgi:hypothetical protein
MFSWWIWQQCRSLVQSIESGSLVRSCLSSPRRYADSITFLVDIWGSLNIHLSIEIVNSGLSEKRLDLWLPLFLSAMQVFSDFRLRMHGLNLPPYLIVEILPESFVLLINRSHRINRRKQEWFEMIWAFSERPFCWGHSLLSTFYRTLSDRYLGKEKVGYNRPRRNGIANLSVNSGFEKGETEWNFRASLLGRIYDNIFLEILFRPIPAGRYAMSG